MKDLQIWAAKLLLLFIMSCDGMVYAQDTSCPEGYEETRREVSSNGKLRLYCKPIDTTTVDLSRTNLADADKALMKQQWDMSIDERYQHDPVVQEYVRNLWKKAIAHNDEAIAADDKLREILSDQLKVSGLSPEKIDAFFNKVEAFLTDGGPVPKEWGNVSKVARDMDAISTKPSAIDQHIDSKWYGQLVNDPGIVLSIKAKGSYMSNGPQHADDCVLHAIANSAQVPLKQVESIFKKTVKNLAMNRIEERKNPDLITTIPKRGGRGGLNPYEEILVAEQLGKVIVVPRNSFAAAIESAGKPVVTTVMLELGEKKKIQGHEIVITGVHRSADGKIYYSIMDSNLKNYKNYSAFVEKTIIDKHMPYNGFIVVK